MSTPLEDFQKIYEDRIDRLYKEIYANKDEASYWRYAFHYLVGYTYSSKGKPHGSRKDYLEHIIKAYEQGLPEDQKRGSK
jgi:hypothetical protein